MFGGVEARHGCTSDRVKSKANEIQTDLTSADERKMDKSKAMHSHGGPWERDKNKVKASWLKKGIAELFRSLH